MRRPNPGRSKDTWNGSKCWTVVLKEGIVLTRMSETADGHSKDGSLDLAKRLSSFLLDETKLTADELRQLYRLQKPGERLNKQMTRQAASEACAMAFCNDLFRSGLWQKK